MTFPKEDLVLETVIKNINLFKEVFRIKCFCSSKIHYQCTNHFHIRYLIKDNYYLEYTRGTGNNDYIEFTKDGKNFYKNECDFSPFEPVSFEEVFNNIGDDLKKEFVFYLDFFTQLK